VVMSETVKLMRSPIDTNCVGCGCKVAFGVWVYYESTTGNALCVECAVKKGWTPKERVNQLIQKLELQEDIKALTKQRKIESDALLLVKREHELHAMGKRDLELEGQITRLMATVEDYLKSCGSEGEKKALKNVFDEVRKAQELQKEVRDAIQNRLFLLERRKSKLGLRTPLNEIESEVH